jgi:hypothetical protein
VGGAIDTALALLVGADGQAQQPAQQRLLPCDLAEPAVDVINGWYQGQGQVGVDHGGGSGQATM